MNDPQRPDDRDGWAGVELRHLIALAAIAKEGSFRGAADELGYVQSAVSQQIAQLERSVNARLIDRAPGSAPVQLTDAGRLLVEHVEELLARTRAAEADFAATPDRVQRTITIGVTPGIARHVLPRILAAFAAHVRDALALPIDLIGDESPVALLARAELDVLLCDALPDPSGLESERLLVDRFVLVTASDSAAARRATPPTAEELRALPLVAQRSPAQTVVDDWLRERGVDPRPVLRAELASSVRALVAAGAGVAVVPAVVVGDDEPGITVREFADDERPANPGVALAWHPDRPPAGPCERFRDIARAVCSAYAA